MNGWFEAIQADLDVRPIFADWLEEQGNLDHADLVRRSLSWEIFPYPEDEEIWLFADECGIICHVMNLRYHVWVPSFLTDYLTALIYAKRLERSTPR